MEVGKVVDGSVGFQALENIDIAPITRFFHGRFIEFGIVLITVPPSARPRVSSSPHQETHPLEVSLMAGEILPERGLATQMNSC